MMKIVEPVNPRDREAYEAILKNFYITGKRISFFHEYVDQVQADCGISQETAIKRCKQLNLLNLLIYINSGLGGHNYRFALYSKNDAGEIRHIDSLPEARQLIESQFGDVVETEFVTIRRMQIENTVKVESKILELSKPILPGEDTIKSEFKTTKKQTPEELCNEIEVQIKSGKDSTLEDSGE